MKWIIDTDPGIDDAAAIVAAVRTGALELTGLTTVGGNAPLANSTRNALRLLELLGAETPVVAGAERPLLEPQRHSKEVHGEDGFGDCGLPEPTSAARPGSAVDFIIESAARYPGELSILALGPLTNLALAVAQDRSLSGKISRIVLMGGTSDARGNSTMVSEFNVGADPEAAAILFQAGIPITMVPLETTLKAMIGDAELRKLEESVTPMSQAYLRISRPMADLVEARLGFRGLVLCDLVAAAVAIDPTIATERLEAYVAVETGGRIARGLTAIDYWHLTGQPPNATVCMNVDAERVRELFLRSFTG